MRANAETSLTRLVALSVGLSASQLTPPDRFASPFLTKRQSAPETNDDTERLDTVLCGNLPAVTVASVLACALRGACSASDTAPAQGCRAPAHLHSPCQTNPVSVTPQDRD